MNLIQQHEKIVNEIESYYTYVSRLKYSIVFRLYYPKNFYRTFRIRLPMVFSITRNATTQGYWQAHQSLLDLLCLEEEKSNPFYEIMRSELMPIHALSQRIDSKFPNFNWTDLEKVNQLRLDLMPIVRPTGFFNFATLAIAVAGFLGSAGYFGSQPIDTIDQWANMLIVGLIYLALMFIIVFLQSRKMRGPLQRTMNVIRYLAIQARSTVVIDRQSI